MHLLMVTPQNEYWLKAKQALDSAGHVVLAQEEDVLGALNAYRRFRPEVVVADLYIKGDALELYEGILGIKGELPLRFLLTHASGQWLPAHRLSGVSTCPYPLDGAQLVSALQELPPVLGDERRLNIPTFVLALLTEMGAPPHLSGFRYLGEAIALCLWERSCLDNLKNGAYKIIAQKHRSSVAAVESALRHTIEKCFSQGNIEALHAIFGYTVRMDLGRPSNRECIALLAETARLRALSG